MDFLYLAVIVGLITTFAADVLPMSLRTVGAMVDEFPLSTLRTNQVMIVNRFGGAVTFACSGLMVDLGHGVDSFLLVFSIAWWLLALICLAYALSWRAISAWLAGRALGQDTIGLEVVLVRPNIRWSFKNYPHVFNILGVSLPIVAASLVPEFRGVLLQLGFIFNSLATFLFLFVIEPKFIKLIADKNPHDADRYQQQLLISKAYIFGFAGMLTTSMLIILSAR